MGRFLEEIGEIVLASNSPRRAEIMKMLGVDVIIDPSDCNEDSDIKDPEMLSMELSKRKAREVANRHPGRIVVGADTIVSIDGDILGKPKDKDEALMMLKRLSGKTHAVYTGVSIVLGDRIKSFSEKSLVTMYDSSEDMLISYIDTKEPMDKAGAYGVQGKGMVLVKSIEGDFFNVMGLPAGRLIREILDLV